MRISHHTDSSETDRRHSETSETAAKEVMGLQLVRQVDDLSIGVLYSSRYYSDHGKHVAEDVTT